MDDKFFIKGQMITGGVGRGKTTLLAHFTNSLMRNNLYWRLCAVGDSGLFGKLDAPILGNNQNEFIEVEENAAPGESERRAAKLVETVEAAFQHSRPTLVVVDEAAHLFTNEIQSKYFAEFFCLLNRNPNNPIYLMVSSPVLVASEQLFGGDFTYNFAAYTVLYNRFSEPFFGGFGIDTREIKPGSGCNLQKDMREKTYTVLPNFGFEPGKPDTFREVARLVPTLAQRIAGVLGVRA